jgi:hypothetical protein
MKKWILIVISFGAVSWGVLVAAQSITTDKTNAGKKDAMVNTVTAIGCVDDGGEAGPYMLTNVVIRGDTKAKARNTASPSSRTLGITYTLTGTDLQRHVGHKVEVTGLLDPTMKKDAKDSTKSQDKAIATARAMNGTFTVQSLKMISSTCP